MRKIWIVLFLVALLVACGPAEITEGPILEWQPTPYGERQALPEVTLPNLPARERPELAEVADVQAEAAPVPTLAPTPIPNNVFVFEANGFMMPFPSSWEITESDETSVSWIDPAMELNVTAMSGPASEVGTIEEVIETLTESLNMEVESEEEIPYAGDRTAQVYLMTAPPELFNVAAWISWAAEGDQSYVLMAFASRDDVLAREKTLRTMVDQAVPGGDLIYGLNRAETLVMLGGDPIPRQLDPARQTGSAAGPVGLIYSGLVRLSPEMQVEPDLAESWTVSSDGTVYTFTLRDGLKFQDGKAITAADFQYSWERATDPDTDSTTAATYLGDIVGVPEKIAGEVDGISGLEVIDDRTLEVTVDGPKPYFLLKLTYPTSFVVDEESVSPEDEEWVFEPNASGPYTLKEVHEAVAFIYEGNANYYDPPQIEHVVYLLYRVGSNTSLFTSNEVDIIGVYDSEAIQVRQPEDDLHENWLSTTSMCTSLIQVNNRMPPMDDVNVRRAFALAVDKEAINELLTEGLDVIAESILPPAMPGYSAERVNEAAASGYDPEAAREALASSAYAGNLPPVTFTAGGYGTAGRNDIEALVSNWQDVLGAEVTVEYLDPQDYTRASRENHGHLASYGWCADYPDPENFLDILYHSESEFNVSGYSNPEIDALLEEARIELDPAQRLALYQEIEAALLADGAAIPLDHGVNDVLVNQRVKGYVVAPMGAPIIHRLWLEPAEEVE